MVFYRSATGKPLSVADKTWINCGYETAEPIATSGNVEPLSLLDWEPHDHVRRSNYNGWRRLAVPACFVYDPLGINPWDYIGVWNTLSGHSRRAMRSLTDHAKRLAEVGIDGRIAMPCISIYPPLGYRYEAYMQWAGAKLKASNQVCRDAGITQYCSLMTLRQNVSANWADSVPHKPEQLEWQVEAYKRWGLKQSGLAVWGYSYNEGMLAQDRVALDLLRDMWIQTPKLAEEFR